MCNRRLSESAEFRFCSTRSSALDSSNLQYFQQTQGYTCSRTVSCASISKKLSQSHENLHQRPPVTQWSGFVNIALQSSTLTAVSISSKTPFQTINPILRIFEK